MGGERKSIVQVQRPVLGEQTAPLDPGSEKSPSKAHMASALGPPVSRIYQEHKVSWTLTVPFQTQGRGACQGTHANTFILTEHRPFLRARRPGTTTSALSPPPRFRQHVKSRSAISADDRSVSPTLLSVLCQVTPLRSRGMATIKSHWTHHGALSGN